MHITYTSSEYFFHFGYNWLFENKGVCQARVLTLVAATMTEESGLIYLLKLKRQ